jgi:ferredoxin
MPTIEFFGNELGPAVSALAPDGGRLIDICDDSRAPVAFSCRSSSCGTCRVEVVAGATLLEPPNREEIEVLEAFAAPPSHRLACQMLVRPGSGLIQLKWTND